MSKRIQALITIVGLLVLPALFVSAQSVVTPRGGIPTVPIRLYLAGDYTNATATFSNILMTANVEAGKKYRFEASLFVTDSVAADGAKLDFAGGTATATNFVATCVLSNAVGTGLTQTAATTAALATALSIASLTDTAVHNYTCTGGLEPATSGTFIMRAAQTAHTTGTLTVKRGSWLGIADAQ